MLKSIMGFLKPESALVKGVEPETPAPKVKVQHIKCNDTRHSKERGCQTCSGFGYVLFNNICGGCGHTFWDHNRSGTTLYPGLIYAAFDGTVVRFLDKNKMMCSHCPVEGDYV